MYRPNFATFLEKQYSKNFVITYVGNTSERRGLLTVIESLKTLRKTVPNIKLLIIGKSSFDYVLKNETWNHGVKDLVDFIGNLETDENDKPINDVIIVDSGIM